MTNTELVTLIQNARRRAFHCEHGSYYSCCGYCALERVMGHQIRSIQEIMSV